MSQQLKLFSDGGARGNPGPAAIAFVAQNALGQTIKTDTCYVGVRTNNQAEYEALLLALNYAAEQKAQEVTCHIDSELVAKQLNGQYSVKNAELQQLNQKVKALKASFKKIAFVNVPREHPQIQWADSLVNKTLDAQASKGTKPKNYPIIQASAAQEVGAGSMFVHVSVRTRDMDRSIDFYSRFFSLKLLRRLEIKQTNSEIAFLQDTAGKGCKLELTYMRDQKNFIQPDYEERLFDHLGFEVRDINRTLTAMRKENITVTDEPYKFNEKTTIAFIEDPDGTLIELIEHK
jgi:lactoylglutathione lyase